MGILFPPLALQDLEEIGDYIAQYKPGRAVSFVQELRDQCVKNCVHPQIYPLRLELGTGIRTCSFDRYLIVFKGEENSVTVARILNGAMDIGRRPGGV